MLAAAAKRKSAMTQYLFKNFEMLDPEQRRAAGWPRVAGRGQIYQGDLGQSRIKAPSANVIDCGKQTLMPGLIDSHVHVVLSEVVHPATSRTCR